MKNLGKNSHGCYGTTRNNHVFAVIYFRTNMKGKGEETLTVHYLRYVNLDANIQSRLNEYDLLGSVSAHYLNVLQKYMISANLNSNQ
jgi:hypothetical protein